MKKKKIIIKILKIVGPITSLATIVFIALSSVYDYEIIVKLKIAFSLMSSVLLIIWSTLIRKEGELRKYIEERERQDSIDPFDDLKEVSNNASDDDNNEKHGR